MSLSKLFGRLMAILFICFATVILPHQPADAAGGPKANFKWIYEFNAAQNEGTLTVTVYNQQCNAKVADYVYVSSCTQQKDHIACELDIQEAANNALGQEGFGPSAPGAQSYPQIFAEIHGSFKKYKPSVSGTVIEHPSLTFNLQASNGTASYMTNWSGVQTASTNFGFTKNVAHTMNTSFSPGKFYHLVDKSAIDADATNASMLPFLLDDTTFKFYQPAGFQLDGAIVDPGTCGFG